MGRRGLTSAGGAVASRPFTESPAWFATRDILSGSVGGACLTVVGHPFDTVKIRLQSSTERLSAAAVVRQTLRHEGFSGLYKGMSSPLAGQLMLNAVCFGAYGQAKRWLREEGASPTSDLPLWKIAMAGSFTGATLTFVESPVDLFKTKMQTQLGSATDKTRFRGAGDAAQHIFRRHGLRGVSQGFGITLLRNIPSNSIYFVTYEAFRRQFVGEGETTPGLVSFFAGGFAGLSYWVTGLPLDVIKSNMQANTYPGGQYSGIFDCARSLYQRYGAAAFIRGLVPSILRSFPANASLFVGYDTAQRLLNWAADSDP